MIPIGRKAARRKSKYYYVYVYRSSVTGKFVTSAFAFKNKRETFKQLIRKPK